MKRIPTASRGFSLIELMVAVVIGLVLTMAISSVVSRQESIRRGVTSSSDMTGNAAYASFMLERELRNAGSGFNKLTDVHWGCTLNVSRSNAQLLPATADFPAPFAAVPRTYALAPLIAYAGLGANGSDIIAVAAGNSGLGEFPLQAVPNSAGAGQLKLANTLGIRSGDLALLAQQGVGCLLQQVSNGFVTNSGPVLTFGGTYAANTVGAVALADFTLGQVSLLGNVVGNQPRFTLLGVRDDGKLYAYDLLQLRSTSADPVVEGVVDMRVRYGIGNFNPNNPATQMTQQVTSWAAPASPGFTAAALTANTPTARNALRSIVAVRVGLVMRSDLVEKTDVAPAALTMFSDLGAGLEFTYTVPTGSTNQRYRVVEFTVPLRNVRYSTP